MTSLTSLLTVTALASSLFVLTLVLLQEPRGGGAGGVLGGSLGSTLAPSARSADRLVARVAAVWIVATLALAVLS